LDRVSVEKMYALEVANRKPSLGAKLYTQFHAYGHSNERHRQDSWRVCGHRL
jgi:hypothetical protein